MVTSGDAQRSNLAHNSAMAILLLCGAALISATFVSALGMWRRDRAGAERSQRALADMLLAALAARDPDLGAHSCDVAVAARIAAKRLGLSRRCIEQVSLAAELHDVGKLAIPEQILGKPARLDPDEWRIMQTHAELGASILNAVPSMAPIGALVLASHEHYDGCGYPNALRGEQIPLGSRIIATCDAYDAMTTQRVYNQPVSPLHALERLRAGAGTQFDPLVVTVVCSVIEELLTAPLADTGPVVAENLAASLTSAPPGALFA